MADRTRYKPKRTNWEHVDSMLGIIQSDIDTYNESIGAAIGGIIGAVLLILAIVWLIKRSRKG